MNIWCDIERESVSISLLIQFSFLLCRCCLSQSWIFIFFIFFSFSFHVKSEHCLCATHECLYTYFVDSLFGLAIILTWFLFSTPDRGKRREIRFQTEEWLFSFFYFLSQSNGKISPHKSNQIKVSKIDLFWLGWAYSYHIKIHK